MHVREMWFSFQLRRDVGRQWENSTLMRESVEESQQQIADIPEGQLAFTSLRRFGCRLVAVVVESSDDIQTRNLTQLGRVKEHQREKYWDYKTRFLMRKKRQQGDRNDEREGHQAHNTLQTWKMQPLPF